MGRQRTFGVECALDVATELFWRQGYDGTTVDELTSAMGITPPSFYLAFRNKEALFRQVVTRYQAEQAQVVDAALGAADARELASRLLNGFAELLTRPGKLPGCLVLNSALPVTAGHPFRQWFAQQRDALRLRLRDRLAELGQTEADALARLAVTLIWGMAVEAQSGATRRQLGQATSALLQMWPPQPAASA